MNISRPTNSPLHNMANSDHASGRNDIPNIEAVGHFSTEMIYHT